MRHRRRQTSGEAGSTIVMALYAVLMLTLALSVVATALLLHLRESQHEAIAVRLTALADAALAEALSQLAGSPFADGVSEHDFGDGTIASEISTSDGTNMVVLARAAYAGRQREVRADVRLTVLGPVVVRWRRVR